VAGSHTYAEEGSYPATVSIKDSGGNEAVATSQITVADAALTATGKTLLSGTGTEFSGAVASFTDPDPNGTVTDYRATIAWGDDTSSIGTISAGSGGFVVSGSHSYPALGPHTVQVSIADVGGSPDPGSAGIGTHRRATLAAQLLLDSSFPPLHCSLEKREPKRRGKDSNLRLAQNASTTARAVAFSQLCHPSRGDYFQRV
jgi:hypothetical protein